MSITGFPAILLVIACGCVDLVTDPATLPATANPASVNCVKLGGAVEIRSGTEGQTGYCKFDDGRVCEEWALFRDKICVAPKPAS